MPSEATVVTVHGLHFYVGKICEIAFLGFDKKSTLANAHLAVRINEKC